MRTLGFLEFTLLFGSFPLVTSFFFIPRLLWVPLGISPLVLVNIRWVPYMLRFFPEFTPWEQVNNLLLGFAFLSFCPFGVFGEFFPRLDNRGRNLQQCSRLLFFVVNWCTRGFMLGPRSEGAL